MAFFVTGMGRSGTMWLARALDEDQGVNVFHEWLGPYDQKVYGRAYHGALDLDEYMRWRLERVANAVRFRSLGRVGEVSSYLRYFVPELRETFGCPVAGLVRDGRMTVASLMGRDVYRKRGRPPVNPPSWLDKGTRLEKACWYWADTYRRLLAQDVPVWRLEDLNKDYAKFADLCSCLGAVVPERAWRRWAGKRVHSSRGNRLPDWDPAERRAFAKMAGDMQRHFGYEL